MEVVKDQADPADQAGGRPMRMILAGKDALKTASRKAPEIPPPRIRIAAAADEGEESEDELPLSRLIEQKAPVSKVPAPTSWSEQLSYPLESAKFPIRIYPMGQAPHEDEDDPWSSCSEPEDDDLLDAGKGCVTELVWCRESF